MRFVVAVAGILVSVPPLLFFGIGTQTFIRSSEKALAVGVTALSCALLTFSVMLLFTASVQRFQVILLIATVAVVGVVLAIARTMK